MATMRVELVGPEREVWSGDAEQVIARTVDGELGVLPGHVSLLGLLAEGGLVRIRPGGEAAGQEEVRAVVDGGFLSVTPEGVSILAESVLLAAEIDVAQAQSALTAARESGDEAGIRRAEGHLRAAGHEVN